MAAIGATDALDQIRGVLIRIEKQKLEIGRRQRGLETYAAILGTAREVYIEAGYAGLTLGKVAERCGANKGNIAYYFPTKSSLLQAVLLQELADYLKLHIKQAEEAESPRAAMLAVTNHYIRTSCNSSPFFLQTWGYISSDKSARELVSEIYAVIVNFIGALIQAAKPHTTKRTARIAAMEIMQTIEGLTVLFGIKLASANLMRTLEIRAAQRIEAIVEEA